MSDLVERLREGRTDGTDLRWTVTDVHREAADEIENLRSAIEDLRSAIALRDQTARDRKEIIRKLEAEIGRLYGSCVICHSQCHSRWRPETWMTSIPVQIDDLW